MSLGMGAAGTLSAIVQLIDRIPEQLLVLDDSSYAEFLASVAILRHALQMWEARGGAHELKKIPGFRELNPVNLVRQALAQCPDEVPSAEAQELVFIGDEELRRSLQSDVEAAYKAYEFGEWKAATVLAGTVVEALLLWAVGRRSTDIPSVLAKLIAAARLARDPGNRPEEWGLHESIEVVEQFGWITKTTAEQCRLAKDFRNLIHPGRSVRLRQACNRATALSALAAVEHAVRDLASAAARFQVERRG